MKARFVAFLMVLTLLVLPACSSAAKQAPVVIRTVEVVKQVEVPAASEAPAEEAMTVVVTAAAPPSSGAAYPMPGSAGVQSVNPLPNPSTGRMIIKDALLELLVDNPDLAIERITSLAADQGGYLISSRVWVENSFKHGELKLGVPSASFEDTLNQLRRMGVQVLNEQSSGTDVSAEYSDAKSRLTNLEATAARVRDFLNQAKTVEESLKINAQLSELEGQIEQVKGQMKFYEGRSAYSTITVLLQPQMPTPTITPTPTETPTPTPTPPWDPGKTVKSASDTMISMLHGMADLGIWGCFLLWPFVLLGILVWWIVRRVRRKKPAKTAPPAEEKEA